MSISESISQLSDDKGISQDLIRKIIEESLVTAYEKTFHTADNAVVRFSDIDNEPTLFAKKYIVETPTDPVMEVSLSEALSFNSDSEIGDELLIEVDPKDFDLQAVQGGMDRAKQCLSDIQKDVLYSEFGDKVGKMVVGYIQHEHAGDIYIDLGNAEGILPKKFQSPREEYRTGDRVKAIICEVTNTDSGLLIVLSRTHADFVRCIFELEVPEIQEHIVEIENIVREPGYRAKIAVYTKRPDVDPVGACVGVRGARIQAVVKELEGEKVDVVSYDADISTFIANALSPARIEHIQIVDETTHTALAIVNEDQLSLAIGKHGLNVRLANKIVGWNIDVKTRAQVSRMASSSDAMKAVSELFDPEEQNTQEEEEITHVSELPGITPSLVLKLQGIRVEHINDLILLSKDERAQLKGLEASDIQILEKILSESVGVIEDGQKDE